MGILTRKKLKFFSHIILIILLSKTLFGNQTDLSTAKEYFLNGDYEKSILLASKINTIESMIFLSRTISIYTNFFMKGDLAKDNYLKAYDVSKKAILINVNSASAYIEAAHSLGRYSQEIGIMSAISKGIANRVKIYLDKALTLDNNNIIANLSKGIWHAEIVNKAGKILAKGVYGAKPESARMHFNKIINLNYTEISILYELSYGYSLLGEKEDLDICQKLLEKLLKINTAYHIENLYKKKAKKLLKKLRNLS